jgi:Flp pilus assembly protein TadG
MEFALSLSVLLLFVMGIFDLGRGVYAYNVISAAAQEGVRYGLIQPTDTNGIRNVVISKTIGLDASQVTTSVSQPESNVIAVTVTHRFNLITPLIAQAVGNGGISLQATAAMRQY